MFARTRIKKTRTSSDRSEDGSRDRKKWTRWSNYHYMSSCLSTRFSLDYSQCWALFFFLQNKRKMTWKTISGEVKGKRDNGVNGRNLLVKFVHRLVSSIICFEFEEMEKRRRAERVTEWVTRKELWRSTFTGWMWVSNARVSTGVV